MYGFFLFNHLKNNNNNNKDSNIDLPCKNRDSMTIYTIKI